MAYQAEYSRSAPIPLNGHRHISEADHRVANSLATISALIRMEASRAGRGPPMSGPQVRKKLDDAASRIDTIAKLHRFLATQPEGEAINCGQQLRSLCDSVHACTLPDGEMSLSYDIAGDCWVAPHRMTALSLLVHEALTNAIKYAHPSGVIGMIEISCRRRGDAVIIAIQDDGVGLPDGLDPEVSGGLGFSIMRALSQQLDATLTWKSTALGLRVEIGALRHD